MANVPEAETDQGAGEEFALEDVREKKEREEIKPKDLGPILFAALAILLLAFFILLNSMSVVDTKRKIKVLGSLQGTFGILTGGTKLKELSGVTASGSGKRQKQFFVSLLTFKDFIKTKGFAEEVFIDGANNGFTISVLSSSIFKPGESELKSKNYREIPYGSASTLPSCLIR